MLLRSTRKSYKRKDGTVVKRSIVGPACVNDRGNVGKGPKILPEIDKNIHLRNYGYNVKDKPQSREKALKKASRELGTLPTLRRLNLIANYNKWNPEVESKMRDDVEYLKYEYKKEKSRNIKRQSKSNKKRSKSKSKKSSSKKSLKNKKIKF